MLLIPLSVVGRELQRQCRMLVVLGCCSIVLANAQASGLGPSCSYLLCKAETLQAAGLYEAALVAFNQATTAFQRIADADGHQRSLTELANMDEQRADQLLAGLSASAATAVAPAAGAPHARTAATVARPVAGSIAAPMAGKVMGGKPVGLFFMTRHIMAFHSLEKATFYFIPTGQVYHNPVDFTSASLAALAPAERGTYTIAGGLLAIKWADGNASKAKFEGPTSNTFLWDMGIFVGIWPFSSARQLVSTFEGGNSVSGSGSAAAVSGLMLRADGTYSGSSVSSFTTNTAESSAYVGGSGEATGRWALAGWTLTLTDTSGHPSRGVAYPIETDEKTGQVTRFYYNNVAYARR